MAKNYLKPFANAADANVMTEADWESPEMQVVVSKGFQSGIARSVQVNRAIAQGTSAGYAIGQLVVDYANQDAHIQATGLYAGFKKALESFAKKAVISFIYPVGSIYISTSATNPATLFGVGTWVRIGEGRGLVDCGSTIKALSTGGSETVTLTANELPAHNHKATAGAAGGHNHTATASSVADHKHSVAASEVANHSHTASATSVADHSHTAYSGLGGKHSHSCVVGYSGNHDHSRGSMNITGKFGCDDRATNVQGGAFYAQQQWAANTSANGGDGTFFQFVFDASRSWTGVTSSNGNHTHTVSIGTQADHKHDITVTSGGGHTHTVTVGAAGKHSHTMTVGNAGAHTHTVNVSTVAAHTHTLTVSNTGSGKAFNVRNPYLAVYIWRRTK